MVRYNPKNWFSLIFQFHKSDTFRILFPTMLTMGLYAGLLEFVEERYAFNFTHQNATVVHSLLGFAMSLLLIFRTNTAYERWWEGRKLWGSMVNDARNLALKFAAFLPENDTQTRKEFFYLISNYVKAMKEHLRNHRHLTSFDPMNTLPLEILEKYQHFPNAIALALFQETNRLHVQSIISDYQFLMLEKEIKGFTDNIGACERIKNTPIPYSYSIFMKKFIFLYVMTLPMGFIPTFGYWTIPIVMFVFYVLVSIELLAEEIENPFGTDANDLPLEEITKTIRKNIEEILIQTPAHHLTAKLKQQLETR
jgi:ion channel-forming bestrophin family protein